MVLFLPLVFLLASCGEQPNTTPTVDNKSGTGSIVSEEELRAFIFNPDYASPEYYKKVKLAVQSVQYQIIREQAIKEQKVDLCNKITLESQQKECRNNYYSNRALAANDVTLCDQITADELVILNCKNRILNTQAITQKNTQPCEQITQDDNMKSACIDNIYNLQAVDKKDLSLCGKIVNVNRKNGCETQVNKILNKKPANTNKNG